MNKQEYTAQLWGNVELTAYIADNEGITTLPALRKLKRAAIEALVAEYDGQSAQPATHSVVPAKYRAKYTRGKSASGKSTLNCGDKLAALMAGMDADQVCRIADAAFGQQFGHHATKYAHLNVGMQRMNAGNRIRGLVARRNK